MDERREPLFASASGASITMPDMPAQSAYVEKDGYYYFRERGAATGLTYLSMIPTQRIHEQIVGLNITLLIILSLSVVIGVTASVWLSKRFKRPIMQIIEALQQPKSFLQVKSKIREFDLITGKIHELTQLNQQIHTDLLTKSSQLESYEYLKKLKMIYSGGMPSAQVKSERFFLILYHLNFISGDRGHVTLERVAYFIREYVHLSVSNRFPDSLAMQIEKNQILSVVFGEEPRERIEPVLRELKSVFDHDKESCLVTVAVSSVYTEAAAYHRAYEEALGLLEQRGLSDETELILEPRPLPAPFVFTARQEEEFFHLLQSGSAAACGELIGKALRQLLDSGASAAQFGKFAADIANKTLHIVESLKADSERLADGFRPFPFREFRSPDQYAEFFERFFRQAAELVRQKKEQADDIVGYVMDFIQTHYAEDISLEQVASRLNLSPSYLSVYIRDKTGANYIDHINTVRIVKAKELLARNELNVQEIGRRIGYHNPTSFIRMFKRFTGTTPKEYRKFHTLQG